MWAYFLLISIIVISGTVVGVLAAKMTKKRSVGTFFNVVIGIAGAAAGYWLLAFLNVSILGSISTIIASIINALIGAVALLVILKLIKR